MLTEAKLRAGSLNSKSNGMESVPEHLSKVVPDPTDIIEKYREALVNYAKVSNKYSLVVDKVITTFSVG